MSVNLMFRLWSTLGTTDDQIVFKFDTDVRRPENKEKKSIRLKNFKIQLRIHSRKFPKVLDFWIFTLKITHFDLLSLLGHPVFRFLTKKIVKILLIKKL